MNAPHNETKQPMTETERNAMAMCMGGLLAGMSGTLAAIFLLRSLAYFGYDGPIGFEVETTVRTGCIYLVLSVVAFTAEWLSLKHMTAGFRRQVGQTDRLDFSRAAGRWAITKLRNRRDSEHK